MDTAIRVENFFKSYGSNNVIKGISFQVNKGEVFALLGPNGAGKTTTLECIEGLRGYDSGSIVIEGRVGVQLQSSSLQANIKAIEAFTLFSKWNSREIDLSLFESLGLTEIKNMQYHQMSVGQKRRIHLALALIGNPDIIFLDEPTAGLDVAGRVALHEHIRRLKEKGKTIILASHDMAEVESLCDRLAILKDGRIAFIGASSDLTSNIEDQSRLLIKTEKPLKDMISHHGYYVFNTSDIGETLLELLLAFKESANKVLDVKIEKDTLEQRFMSISKEEVE
jgi:ABC-2 type transport system ATP-binding protein